MDPSIKEAKTFDLQNSCRTCFKSGRPLRSVFMKAVGKMSFANIIAEISHLNDPAADKLSKKICFKCQEAAIVYWEFRETVLNSEKQMFAFAKSSHNTETENENVEDYEFLFLANEKDEVPNNEDLVEQEHLVFVETESADDNQSATHEIRERSCLCSICGAQFTSSMELSYHISQIHEAVEKEKTARRKEKREFQKDSQGRFVCNICEKTYSTRDTLARHIFKHNSEKDFKCNFCPREFFFRRDLNVHLKQQHFDPKKFKCEVCNVEFSSKAARRKHSLVHLEKEKRKFQCDRCELSFKTKGVLQNHCRTHARDKRFVCQKCPNAPSFTQKIIYQRHMKNVHHENIYRCEWCNESFEMHGHLREHWKECTILRRRGNYEIVVVSSEDVATSYELQNETAVRSIEVDFDED